MKCTLCGDDALTHFVGPDGKTTGVARCGPHRDYPVSAKDFDGAALARFFHQRKIEGESA